MATGQLALQIVARHGAAIDRLRRDMLAEPGHDDLLRFLAYDTASFVYAFLLATGNKVTVTDRALRDELMGAVLDTLAKHDIESESFRVWPEIPFGASARV